MPVPLTLIAGAVAAIPFAAALVVGLLTGRVSAAAWTSINADRCAQPVLFWMLIAFNAAMSAALVYACALVLGGSG